MHSSYEIVMSYWFKKKTKVASSIDIEKRQSETGLATGEEVYG
jgi:hypothetical protein